MDRETLLKLWDDLWETGLWAASLAKATEGLTPRQAAWRPDLPPGEMSSRHSIWQNVHHIIFWREVALRRMMGGPSPNDGEVASRNFDAPTDTSDVTESNWQTAREQLGQSQRLVRDAIGNPGLAVDRVPLIIAHDCYHLGQIMQLRALQGLKPIE